MPKKVVTNETDAMEGDGIFENIEQQERGELIEQALDGTLTMELAALNFNEYEVAYLDRAVRLIPADTDNIELVNLQLKLFQLFVSELSTQSDRHDAVSHYEPRRHLLETFAGALVSQKPEIGKRILQEIFQAVHAALSDEPSRYKRGRSDIYEMIKELLKQCAYYVDSNQDGQSGDEKIDSLWSIWKYWDEMNATHGTKYGASSLLFDAEWKQNVRDWKPLHKGRIVLLQFIKDYGPNSFSSALKLASGIGMKTVMPDAISIIAELIHTNQALGEDFGSQYMYQFIDRTFYEYGKQIKQNSTFLTDFIFILDSMIDSGSSEAYLIRENLITYR